MIQHPNKQQNILKMKDKRARRWHRRAADHSSAPRPPHKPTTSTTWKPGRVSVCSNAMWGRWGYTGTAFLLYIDGYDPGWHRSWLKCPCDNCVRERENPRLRKERPAKDVEAAKLREFKRKKEAAHE